MARLMESTLLNSFEYLVDSLRILLFFHLNGTILPWAEVYLMLLWFVDCSAPCSAGLD